MAAMVPAFFDSHQVLLYHCFIILELDDVTGSSLGELFEACRLLSSSESLPQSVLWVFLTTTTV